MKPIILVFVSFYLPGYRAGGPIRSIGNMVENLSADFNFYIVTSDRDFGGVRQYPNIQIDAWNTVGKAQVYYASPANQTFIKFMRLLKTVPYDLLYVNSLFDLQFTINPLLARWIGLIPRRPFIVAPRGELSAAALKLKSWKKRPFIHFAQTIGMFDDAYWHASTKMEQSQIENSDFIFFKRSIEEKNIFIAPDLFNLTNSAPESVRNSEKNSVECLRICFLSRISPMKNLEYALKVLSQVKTPTHFRIYGPKEDLIYWGKCKVVIASLPTNVKVEYCGSVDHNQVMETISQHDIFFVPSLGENFGHVFIESLAAGVPILVSDRTPWRDLESLGIGWDIPLDQPEKFAESIEHMAQLSLVQRQKMKLECLNFAKRQGEDDMALSLNREMFKYVLRDN